MVPYRRDRRGRLVFRTGGRYPTGTPSARAPWWRSERSYPPQAAGAQLLLAGLAQLVLFVAGAGALLGLFFVALFSANVGVAGAFFAGVWLGGPVGLVAWALRWAWAAPRADPGAAEHARPSAPSTGRSPAHEASRGAEAGDDPG